MTIYNWLIYKKTMIVQRMILFYNFVRKHSMFLGRNDPNLDITNTVKLKTSQLSISHTIPDPSNNKPVMKVGSSPILFHLISQRSYFGCMAKCTRDKSVSKHT